MNRRSDFRQNRDQIKWPPYQAWAPHDDEPSLPEAADVSMTGFESQYLLSLIEANSPIVVVLRQGERIAGQLIWYDRECLKVTPDDGSPSLLIPKTSIKYLHEAVFPQLTPSDDSNGKETTLG